MILVFAIIGGNEGKAFSVGPDGTVGYFSSIIGHPSFVSVKARSETFVAYFSIM